MSNRPTSTPDCSCSGSRPAGVMSMMSNRTAWGAPRSSPSRPTCKSVDGEAPAGDTAAPDQLLPDASERPGEGSAVCVSPLTPPRAATGRPATDEPGCVGSSGPADATRDARWRRPAPPRSPRATASSRTRPAGSTGRRATIRRRRRASPPPRAPSATTKCDDEVSRRRLGRCRRADDRRGGLIPMTTDDRRAHDHLQGAA